MRRDCIVPNDPIALPEIPESREKLDDHFVSSMGDALADLEKQAHTLVMEAIEQAQPLAQQEYDQIITRYVGAYRVLSRYRAEVAASIAASDRESAIPGKVAQWLRRMENAYCDACIAAEFTLTKGQQATRITRALAATEDFVRFRGICHACGRERLVTQSVE